MEGVISVENISELRQLGTTPGTPIPGLGSLAYVKYHSTLQDGGGGFFLFIKEFPDRADNDGTIIESQYYIDHPPEPLNGGRWIRQYVDYMSVRFFGASGISQPGDGARIQKAINAAADNVSYSSSSKGTTVFIPSGSYIIAKPLKLKNGVSIKGDGVESTILYAAYAGDPTEPDATDDGYMMELDCGKVSGCNVSDITFSGNILPKYGDDWNPNIVEARTKGCMNFDSHAGTGERGLWNSTFKNINILHFNGPGINLIGGEDYFGPNQVLIFENVNVHRQKNYVTALWIENQAGQITFINSGFDGVMYRKPDDPGDPDKLQRVILGQNIEIKTYNIELSVISFINSTIQGSESGVLITNGESITFDTCWFESLDSAITAVGSPEKLCKGINVMNSRFANAAGFGSLEILNLPGARGSAIVSSNAEMNVMNNVVKASIPDNITLPGKRFIFALDSNKGIRTLGNSFQSQTMGNTYGMNQVIIPGAGGYSPDTIDLRDNNSVYVHQPETGLVISTIISSVCPGEIINIRAYLNTLSFDTGGNVFLSGQSNLTLNNDDIATFVKFEYNSVHIYHLISVLKSTTVI